MTRIGYFLSSEEFGPQELLAQARMAEQAGFEALWISDHYHPWLREQGESPFVWSVIGALAHVCSLPVTTAVTCPTVRTHPAVIAQAAATCAVMHEGRFSLGVGSGEALNEHILGDHWPEAAVRLEMLEEAVEVMRLLWQDGEQSHRGKHYTVENARVDAAGRAAAGARLRLRTEGRRPRRAHRGRLLPDHARRGPDRPLPLARRRRQARPGGHQAVLGRGRGERRRDRARPLAERGAAR
jgi:hypothetical protein